MTASYPSSIVSFAAHSDGEVVDNTHVNALQEEITAVETTLGTGLTTKSAATYSSLTSSFTSLTARLNNMDAGIASTNEGIHPQYLLKKGGTILPTGGTDPSLTIKPSPQVPSDSPVFTVMAPGDGYSILTVAADGVTTIAGTAYLTQSAQVGPNETTQRALRISSSPTYAGPMLESIKGVTTTALLDAAGNLTLSGDLVVSGNVSIAGSVPTHTHNDSAQGGRVIPAGALMPYAGTTAIPEGWLLCDGQTVSRSTYADLFAAIGATYGSGDGSTTFQVPNLKGRVPVGSDSGQSEFSSLGQTGGSKSSVASHSHGVSHTHAGSTGSMSANSTHAHTYPVGGSGSSGAISSQVVHASSNVTAGATPNVSNASTEHTHTFSTGEPSEPTSSSAGTASGNLQPYLTVSYLIKV